MRMSAAACSLTAATSRLHRISRVICSMRVLSAALDLATGGTSTITFERVVDPDPGGRADDDGGLALLDDRRPLERGAGARARSGRRPGRRRIPAHREDRRGARPSARAPAGPGPRPRCVGSRSAGRGPWATTRQRDRLDRRVADGVAVDRAVGGLEAPVDLVAPGGVERPVGERARGSRSPASGSACRRTGGSGRRSAGIARPRTARPSASISATARATAAQSSASRRAGERAHEVERERRHQEAHRRHHAGAQRVDHARAPEDAGHAEGVHGPGAAEGEDREALDVLAALDRVDARGARHALVGELVDAPGRLDGVEPERPPDPLGDRAPRRVPVEPHLAAEEEVGVEVAEHQVGVGHGRLRAAEAVADRARAARPRSRARRGAGAARRRGRSSRRRRRSRSSRSPAP